MATTTNYAFELPTVGGDDAVWGGSLNQNWTDLDADLTAIQADINSRVLTSGIGSAVQAWDTDLDTYAANPLTAGELGELQNIGTVTISAAQWGYLGAATAFGASLMDDANAAAGRTTLEVVGGLEFIESQDASSDSTIDLTSFDASAYDGYQIRLDNVDFGSSTLTMRTSTDGGTGYDSGASDYAWRFLLDATTEGNSAADTEIELTSSYGATAVVSGTIDVFGPDKTENTVVSWDLTVVSGSLVTRSVGGGVRLSAADVNAVQLLPLSGTLTGRVSFFGYRNAA